MTYFKSGYSINDVDLSQYFPAYETLTQSFTSTTSSTLQDISLNTFYLNRNTTNSTNYNVFVSFEYTSGTDTAVAASNSSNTTRPIVHSKTASNFSVLIKGLSGWNGIIYCLVVYIPETVRPIITSVPYTISDSSFITNYFPQYSINSITLNTQELLDISTNISLSNKESTSTDYMSIGSAEYISGDITTISQRFRTILFYNTLTPNNTAINSRVFIRILNGATVSVYLNALTIYKLIIPDNNFTTSNYALSINGNVYDLAKIFPLSEFLEYSFFANTFGSLNILFTLQKNTRATTDYLVFPSYFYTYTTNITESAASQNLGTILITTKTATSFRCIFSLSGASTTYRGGVRCFIIYI